MTTGTEQLYREKGDTWPKVLKYNHERYGDTRRAMRHKHYGIWQPYTWKDYYLHAKSLALGLLALGLIWFFSISSWTVIPWRAAIVVRVSPARMMYCPARAG